MGLISRVSSRTYRSLNLSKNQQKWLNNQLTKEEPLKNSLTEALNSTSSWTSLSKTWPTCSTLEREEPSERESKDDTKSCLLSLEKLKRTADLWKNQLQSKPIAET